MYIGSLDARTSLHRNNIKIEENRKLNVSKHLYESSLGKFLKMLIFQTLKYLFQREYKRFIRKYAQTHTHTHIYMYIYIYIYICICVCVCVCACVYLYSFSWSIEVKVNIKLKCPQVNLGF